MSETKKSLPIALILSLLVNATLIGSGAAILYSMKSERHAEIRHSDPKGPPGGGGPFEERLTRSAADLLTDEQKRDFRRALAKEFRDTKDQRDRISAARRELVEIFSAEEFDRAAAEMVFDEISDLEFQLRGRLRDRLLNVIESLPTKERLDLMSKAGERVDDFRDRRDGPPRGAFGDRPPPRHGFGPPPDGFGPPPGFDGPPQTDEPEDEQD